jgi:hypothetical protein
LAPDHAARTTHPRRPRVDVHVEVICVGSDHCHELGVGEAARSNDTILGSGQRQPLDDWPRDARALLVNVSCAHIAWQVVRNHLEVNRRLIADVEDPSAAQSLFMASPPYVFPAKTKLHPPRGDVCDEPAAAPQWRDLARIKLSDQPGSSNRSGDIATRRGAEPVRTRAGNLSGSQLTEASGWRDRGGLRHLPRRGAPTRGATTSTRPRAPPASFRQAVGFSSAAATSRS